MSNKLGYILGLSSAIIYTIVIYGFDLNYILDFVASLLGALLFPAIIAGLISIFSKGKNFGKVFGITCIILHLLAGFGNSAI
jgi:membrane-bound metal-dependent hydrolase YbcI (DUF457 family)